MKPYGKRRALWHPAGQAVNVRGYEIKGGLVYVGANLQSQVGIESDASLINPELESRPAEPGDRAHQTGYWPCYEHISPECRGAYLKWLADGRSEPEVNIGYVFLFFYGLERRLMVDGRKGSVPESERAEIVREVERLQGVYGGNRSFHGYSHGLLAMQWMLYQKDRAVLPFMDFDNKRYLNAFEVLLGRYAAAKKAIPADVALQWMKLHFDYRPTMPARRCAKEFQEMFSRRYGQRYGEGLAVVTDGSRLKANYYPASGTIKMVRASIPEFTHVYLPLEVVVDTIDMAEECAEELLPYSRIVGSRVSRRNSPAALAMLPEELRHLSPAFGEAKSLLSKACSTGPGFITVKDLYSCLGETPPERIGNQEAKNLAALIEATGFGMAPDIRFHQTKPDPDGKAAVFANGHGGDFQPSGQYILLCATIRLGAMVDQSSPNASKDAVAMLKSMITENGGLTPKEKASLLALLRWCLDTPQGAVGVPKLLAECRKEEKAIIGRKLVLVAVADGSIDPGKTAILDKLYPILGLDRGRVARDLHALATEHEPASAGPGLAGRSFSVLAPYVPAGRGNGFSLDEELLRRRAEETRQAKGVLEEVFGEREEERAVENIAAHISREENPLSYLDQAHRDLFHRLIQREEWESSRIERLCGKLGLMADGAMETLNEWFFDHANAPLIEGGEPVRIDVEGAKGMLKADR